MKKTFQNFGVVILTQYFLILVSRFYELIEIKLKHPVGFIYKSEILGFIFDISFANLYLTCLFPFFYLLHWFHSRFAKILFVTGLAILFFLKICILQYFIFELKPLDIFLFQHSKQEVFSTIRSAEVNYVALGIFVTAIIICGYLVSWLATNLVAWKRVILFLSSFVIISIPFYFIFNSVRPFSVNENLVENKSLHFYSACFKFYLQKKSTDKSNESFEKITKEYREIFKDKVYLTNDFTYLHKLDSTNVLGNFFIKKEEKPNIVVLIVEGLANDFIHPYHGFELMPFLDSLSKKSLYWDRFLTLGERSYAVTPSLIGSLPYGEIGFTLLERQPYHFSLVNVLKDNGYYTSFYYGQGAWFHNKNVFYNNNLIDRITDKDNFSKKYNRVLVKSDGYFWGYNDRNLFKQSEEDIEKTNNKNRLDIYFTGTMHNPFDFENETFYFDKIKKAASSTQNKNEKEFYDKYKKYLASVMFTNDALNEYFEWYKKRSDFKNTIFIITGDHPMTDIPITNSIKRYHVPLIIYSPQLKSTATFHSVSSHLDILETLFCLLKNNFGLRVPELISSIGSVIDTGITFRCSHPVVFMNGNRDIVDVIYNKYMLSDSKDLSAIDENFNTKILQDQYLINQYKKILEIFRSANNYVCKNDKLLPDTCYFSFLKIKPEDFLEDYRDIKTSEEGIQIISARSIQNQNYLFDISCSTNDFEGTPPTIVYEVTDKNGKSLLWKSVGIPLKNKTLKHHLFIPKQEINDSMLTFRSYFFNEKKHRYNLKFKTALYRIPTY